MVFSRYTSLAPDEIPDTESLATTLARVLPYWESEIVPDIKGGKKVLVRFPSLFVLPYSVLQC